MTEIQMIIMRRIIKVVKNKRALLVCLFCFIHKLLRQPSYSMCSSLNVCVCVCVCLCVVFPLAVTSGPEVCVTFSGVCVLSEDYSADRLCPGVSGSH